MKNNKKIKNGAKKKGGFFGEIISKLKEFGIDEKSLIEVAVPFGMKFFDELKREVFRFEAEQKRISELRNGTLSSARDLIIQNISSTRNFLLTLVTFSLTVSGIFISAIFSSKVSISWPIFFGIPLAYLGLASLALSITIAVLYLTFIHVREGEELRDYLNFQEKMFKDFNNILVRCYKEKKSFDVYLNERQFLYDKEYKEIEEKNIKDHEKQLCQKDRAPYIISIFFLIGISFIVVSILMSNIN
jgi:hypothetical protein